MPRHAADCSRSSSMASVMLSAEKQNSPRQSNTSTCPRTYRISNLSMAVSSAPRPFGRFVLSGYSIKEGLSDKTDRHVLHLFQAQRGLHFRPHPRPVSGDPRPRSPASYAIRFAASLEGVLVVLSGMSTLAQVEDNTAYMQDMKPLTDKERALLRSVKAAYAKTWKFACDDFAALERNDAGVPISGIIRACNSLLIQPNPYFGAELNYYKSFRSAYDRSFETADYSAADARHRRCLRRERRAEGVHRVSDEEQLPELYGVSYFCARAVPPKGRTALVLAFAPQLGRW